MASTEISKLVQSVVEPYLLSGERKYNRRQVADRTGVPSTLSRRLWVSLGFPADPDDEAIEYTDADVQAVRAFTKLNVLARADVPRQTAAARQLGQSMARLAEWQVDLVTEEILDRIAAITEADPAADPQEAARAATEEVVSELEQLLSMRGGGGWPPRWRGRWTAVRWRGPGAAAGGRVRRYGQLHASDPASGPRGLSALLESFETVTSNAITAGGGWVIKNVGDEVMYAAGSAEQGARISLAIQEAAEASPGITTQLRIGLAYGPVLQRFGDLYGDVVNVAARLTGVARPGTVLIDDGAAARLDGDSEFTLRHLRSVRVRGISRLRGHVLRRNEIRPLI